MSDLSEVQVLLACRWLCCYCVWSRWPPTTRVRVSLHHRPSFLSATVYYVGFSWSSLFVSRMPGFIWVTSLWCPSSLHAVFYVGVYLISMAGSGACHCCKCPSIWIQLAVAGFLIVGFGHLDAVFAWGVFPREEREGIIRHTHTQRERERERESVFDIFWPGVPANPLPSVVIINYHSLIDWYRVPI